MSSCFACYCWVRRYTLMFHLNILVKWTMFRSQIRILCALFSLFLPEFPVMWSNLWLCLLALPLGYDFSSSVWLLLHFLSVLKFWFSKIRHWFYSWLHPLCLGHTWYIPGIQWKFFGGVDEWVFIEHGGLLVCLLSVDGISALVFFSLTPSPTYLGIQSEGYRVFYCRA